MLKCLVDPAMKILANRAAKPIELFYASEVVGHVERLLIEMFSGNESLIPKALWDYYDVVDGIYTRCWPSFDKRKLNFRETEIELSNWPRVGAEEILSFIQKAGIRFHFSSKVWGLQQGVLEGLIRVANGGALCKSRVVEEGSRVLQTMVAEWRVIILRALELEINIAKADVFSIGHTGPENVLSLKKAVRMMKDNPHILKKE
jgi:hypothetical protein